MTTDREWMQRALERAHQAEQEGEVPVGALVVLEDELIGEGYNRSVTACDPSAHAEILALRAAAARLGNYRLPGTTLYVTLEPCAMCAGAIIQARTARVVFGAADPKGGAAGSVFDLLNSDRLNHRAAVESGIMEAECGELLRSFFQDRRE